MRLPVHQQIPNPTVCSSHPDGLDDGVAGITAVSGSHLPLGWWFCRLGKLPFPNGFGEGSAPPPSIPPLKGEGGERALTSVIDKPVLDIAVLKVAKRAAAWGKRALCPLFALLLLVPFTAPVLAIDPPYQRQMERLSEIMGSLYFLQPLCKAGTEDWRAQMADLIALDEPDEDRRQRLAGAFNSGYEAFARFHHQCTPASREALRRLLGEAQKLAREIHTRFAE